MTKTHTFAIAAFALMCSAPLAAQTPVAPVAPAPPAPAAPSAPHVLPMPAAPAVHPVPFDYDFHFDAEAFKVDMDHWKAEIEHWKSGLAPFAFHPEPLFELAQQVPTPRPPAVVTSPVPPGVIRYTDASNLEGLYDQARGFIDRDQYSRALDPLERLIATGGTRADAAMYWKAYSFSKMARAADAMTAIAELSKKFPESPWIREARYLEAELKQAAGQPVGAAGENSDEITLLALRGLMQSDPETALPTIEKLLAGNKSVRVKTQALYVVSQNNRSARARDIIINVAKGNAVSDLKMAAIRSLGQMSGTESRQALVDIYRSSSDVDVKRAVIRSLQSANAVDELSAIARTEKDPDLKRNAIRFIGSTNRVEAVATLSAIYTGEENVDVKKEVIRALVNNRNGGAKALVDLARAEKNIELKTEIVRQLANSRDAVAKEYLLELLK